MNVFVTGGTGFVGTEVVRKLVEGGHTVWSLVRSETVREQPNVIPVRGDLLEPHTYAAAASKCDAVIHLVGIIREIPNRNITFERLHVEGTSMLATVARESGIKRFIHMSALGASDDSISGYHQSKYKAEQIIRHCSIPHIIFRPSVIFGSKDEFVNMLAGLVKNPVTPVIGSGQYRLQPVSVQTVSDLFVQAMTVSLPDNPVFDIGGPDILTYQEMLLEIGRALHRKVRMIHMPLAFMKPVIELLGRYPFFPITRDQLHMLLDENISRDGNRYTAYFTVDPVSFADGIREYLRPT